MQKKMLFLFALVLSLSPKSRSEKKNITKNQKLVSTAEKTLGPPNTIKLNTLPA